jgi:hypothetical protein
MARSVEPSLLPAHDEPHKQDDQNDNSHNDNSDLVNGIHGVASLPRISILAPSQLNKKTHINYTERNRFMPHVARFVGTTGSGVPLT